MDFYVILGLPRGATLADVKRAYKRLARKYHPDINPGDRAAAAQFRQIAEAYETLSDADRRRRYDTTGTPVRDEGKTAYGFEGFDFTVSVAGDHASTFGDLFADVLRERESRRGDGEPVRGIDLHHGVTLDFDEAIRGGQRSLTVTREEVCRGCAGRGRLHVTETRCVHCHGSGVLKAALGAKIDVPSLDGPARLRVPPGTQSGQRFRIRERGVPGRDGRRGDLVVEVRLMLPKLLDERSKELLREFGRINGDDLRRDLS